MKELFPICKDSRRLVNEHLLNDGNDVLLVLVLVFEPRQPTARSQSQRSMLEVSAFTFALPSLCLARGRTAHRPQGAAYAAGLYTNDIPHTPYLQGHHLPAPEFGAVMTLRSTPSSRRTGEADRPCREHAHVQRQRGSTKGMRLSTAVQHLLNATDRHALALPPTAQARISSTF